MTGERQNGFGALEKALAGEAEPDTAIETHGPESAGRKNAVYASGRARALPSAYVDPAIGAPAVIVAHGEEEAAPPSAPSAPALHAGQVTAQMEVVAVPTKATVRMRAPASDPSLHAARPVGPQSPAPFPIAVAHATPLPISGPPGSAPRLPVAPVGADASRALPPRKPAPTIVMRPPRAPSFGQKALVFTAVALAVCVVGLAIVFWRAPQLLGGAGAASTTAAPAR